MVGWAEVLRGLRRLHWLRESDPVEGELRGWSWDRPPVRPRAYLGLGVSEVAYRYCPTRRDLWLRRKAGLRGEARGPVRVGAVVHEVFHAASSDVRRLLARGLSGWEVYERLAAGARRRLASRGVGEGWAVGLYKHLVLWWAAESAKAEALLGGEGVSWLPWLTEYRVDGSALGLSSSLRVDALGEAGLVVEVKYGRGNGFHGVGLAGYALALEACLEVPVDYGLVVYVEGVEARVPRIRLEPVYISASLRREFLEARDEAIDVLLSGAEPPAPPRCSEHCPLRGVCSR